MMNNTVKFLAVVFVCFLAGCEEVDELTKFDLTYQSSYNIPATTIVNTPISITTPEITTNSSSQFENNDTNKDLVESVKLKSLTLDIDSPEEGNFNFLNEIYIFMQAEGLEEVELAFATNIPEDGRSTLDLETTGVELKEYIKKDSYTLRVQTTTDGVIDEEYELQIESVFRVDAKILGI